MIEHPNDCTCDQPDPCILDQVQEELIPWSAHNFPGRPSWQPLLGISEEVGELHHAFLKREQNIRGTKESHNEKIKDALGDILVYMADFANSEGLNLTRILSDVWAEVRERDWRPETHLP